LSRLSEIASPIRPLREDTPGSTVYDRFAAEPDLLAIAVVDARGRPLGLVERHAFSLRMASEYGRALYARRPVALLMDPTPLIVDGQTQIMAFTGETLSTHASDILKGFIVVEEGRYVGVANSIALLQAASLAHQNQAEQMQRLAESAQLLFKGNPIAMLVSDRGSYRIRAANSAALQQYGYTLEQFLDLTLLDLVSPDLQAALERNFRDHDTYDGIAEWSHLRADGAALIVEPFRRPITYEGRPAMLSALFDVTSRRRNEDEMRQTRTFLDTVVENIPEILIARDAADERIILVNRAAETWMGLTRAEIIGKTDHDLFSADEADAFRSRRRASLAAGRMEAIEESIRSTKGEERIVETRFAAVAGGEGRAPFSLAICQDVTQQKRDAAALRQALEAAEASNRAKSQFLANMSHEIRTPMNGVVGVADALSATPLAAPQREMVSIIQSSAKALNRLLSDILDLSRVEAGRLDINYEPFRLEELVRDAAALFEPTARAKALDFTLTVCDAAFGVVEGDPVRIQQILFNLLSNAVKFTAEGSVRLDVARRSDASGASEVWFEVRDTGVGFDANKAQAVFDRFQQADGSITRQYGGSGLGLTISKELAELMGGSLTAESAQGAGALFRLRLPLPVCADQATEAELAEGGERARSGSNLRILVADDHPTNLRVIELILGAAGCELVQVENGALAVEAFKTQAFDVVLMDLQMPVMDGLSAIAAIRAWESDRSRTPSPILALSANALSEHVQAARAAGADAHLAKPITAVGLFDALDRLLLQTGPVGPPEIERQAATA
jgi:PAS domain S-box-containing protein